MSRMEGRIKSSYFVSTISITLVLVVVGALVFLLLNARMMSDQVKRNIGFVVMIKDHTHEAEIKRIQKVLDTRPYTHSSLYVTKEEAAKSFKEEIGEDFEVVLGMNPLLPSIELRLNPAYANNDSLEMIAGQLQLLDGVHDIYYQRSMVQQINDNIRQISLAFLAVGAVLMLISFTLIRNTIHMAVYSQRLLIKTMQLVGATSFFISRPFLGGSMWRGFFGGMMANILLLGALFFIQRNYGDMIEVNILHRDTIVIMVVCVVLCGMLLSLLSAWGSVHRYLRKDLNDLYA